MYDAEDSVPASNSTPVIDLVTDSTSISRKLPLINQIEETPSFVPINSCIRICPSITSFSVECGIGWSSSKGFNETRIGQKRPISTSEFWGESTNTEFNFG